MQDDRPIYIRRLATDDRLRLIGRFRRRPRYEVWRGEGEPDILTFSQLDRVLDGRHRPADFSAVVHQANAAFRAGDHRTWFRADFGPNWARPPHL